MDSFFFDKTNMRELEFSNKFYKRHYQKKKQVSRKRENSTRNSEKMT